MISTSISLFSHQKDTLNHRNSESSSTHLHCQKKKKKKSEKVTKGKEGEKRGMEGVEHTHT